MVEKKIRDQSKEIRVGDRKRGVGVEVGGGEGCGEVEEKVEEKVNERGETRGFVIE